MKINVNLNGGFKTVKEGNRDLEITKVEVIPSGAPNEFKLYMKDVEDGATLINSYKLNNSKGLWAMGVMLNIALGIKDGDDFDTKDANKLVGIVLRCEIVHNESNGNTYANVKKVIEKVDRDAEMTKLAEDTSKLLYSRSDLEDDDLD